MTDVATGKLTQVPLEGFVGKVLEALGSAVIEIEQCDARRGFARIDPDRTIEVAKKPRMSGTISQLIDFGEHICAPPDCTRLWM